MTNNTKSSSGEKAGMRLDKFLKVSRIIKRRSLANDACDTDHVSVNGKPAKPGMKIKPGDMITLRYGDSSSDFEILSIDEHVCKDEASQMYRMIK